MISQKVTDGKVGGLVKVGAFSPKVHIGDPVSNAFEIIKTISNNKELKDCALVVTPELSLTGYTCQDMFFNQDLLNRVQTGIQCLLRNDTVANQIISVGAPVKYMNKLFNCSILICNHQIVQVTPKYYLPNYQEFYEKRWFSSGFELAEGMDTNMDSDELIPVRNRIAHACVGYTDYFIGAEVCEDLWAPNPPSTNLALAGAHIIVNNSASNEIIGKAKYRRNIVKAQSAKTISAYVYCSAGYTESVSDVVFGGHNMIAENGTILAESDLFDTDCGIVVADIDIDKLNHDRMVNKTVSVSHEPTTKVYVSDKINDSLRSSTVHRTVDLLPFVPKGDKLTERCKDIFNIQVAALAARWEKTGSLSIIVGVSGGLDSTLALLVAVGAADRLNKDRASIIGITMPCFGTTDRTKNNAILLMEQLGCTIKEVNIGESVKRHMQDIGLSEDDRTVAYENAQARERTQVLMDSANMYGGFVLGTGDLSELALGWCTYNGDHMSMYNVNGSIPKTLVRSLVGSIGKLLNASVVEDIINTPVSPELLPPSEDGSIAQLTEDSVGPYVLNDFFLYNHIRNGFSAQKILELTVIACEQSDEYKFSREEIVKWLNKFYARFYRAQFKRNCSPDGVKVGSVSFNPRGDWRCPSEYAGAVSLK